MYTVPEAVSMAVSRSQVISTMEISAAGHTRQHVTLHIANTSDDVIKNIKAWFPLYETNNYHNDDVTIDIQS